MRTYYTVGLGGALAMLLLTLEAQWGKGAEKDLEVLAVSHGAAVALAFIAYTLGMFLASRSLKGARDLEGKIAEVDVELAEAARSYPAIANMTGSMGYVMGFLPAALALVAFYAEHRLEGGDWGVSEIGPLSILVLLFTAPTIGFLSHVRSESEERVGSPEG